MIGQGQGLVDEIIDLVTSPDAAGSAMAAQVEGEDGEAVGEQLHHTAPGLQIGADAMKADERVRAAAVEAVVEGRLADAMASHRRHARTLARARSASCSRAAKKGMTSLTNRLIVFLCSSKGRLKVR